MVASLMEWLRLSEMPGENNINANNSKQIVVLMMLYTLIVTYMCACCSRLSTDLGAGNGPAANIRCCNSIGGIPSCFALLVKKWALDPNALRARAQARRQVLAQSVLVCAWTRITRADAQYSCSELVTSLEGKQR